MKSEMISVVRPSLPPMDEYILELEDIWKSGWLTNQGPKHQLLEKELNRYLDVENTSLFANGHMALEAALSILPSSGEVITTPFTFASTTQAIVRAGLCPVFCDIDPEIYTMDPERIRELITVKTCALMPVHVYGNICDWKAMESIAREYNLVLIYDAAHAFGTTVQGRGVGGLGDISMFSFHSTKVFNTIEGGSLCYKDNALSEHFVAWRQFGMKGKEDAELIGTNAKMNEFQAAMGLCNLKHVEDNINKRKAIVMRYREHLSHLPGVRLCADQKGVQSNYAYFPVLFDPKKFGSTRDDIAMRLEQHQIFSRKYFYPLTSAFSAYAGQKYAGETPIAEQIASKVLTLPLYADLEISQVDRICAIIKA